jgi:hypothetical protein
MDVKIGSLQISSGGQKPEEKKDTSKIDPRRVTDADVFELYGPRKEILSWIARPTIQKTKFSPKSIRSFSIVGIVVGLILALMGEFFLLLLIISVLFFMNALNKVQPEDVRYNISNYGVSIDDDIYYWFNLKQFFLFDRDGVEMLAVDTTLNLPRRLFISLGPGADKEKLVKILSERLVQLDGMPTSVVDKTYENIIGKFDLK